MGSPVSIEVEGMDGVRRMLAPWVSGTGPNASAARALHNRLRRAVRAGAKPFQAGLKAAAVAEPTGNVPNSFRKVPAAKVSASMRRGGEIVAKVKPKSPLFNVFEPGAGGHDITGPFLGGPAGAQEHWSQAGRKRAKGFAAHGTVHHPGMKARPLRPTAFAAGKGPALMAIARVLFEGSDR
jgi:hypothetical protein